MKSVMNQRYRETDEGKLIQALSNYKVQCSCGTKTIMIDAEKCICRGCGHWLYRNKNLKFQEEMKKRLKNENRTKPI